MHTQLYEDLFLGPLPGDMSREHKKLQLPSFQLSRSQCQMLGTWVGIWQC